MKKSNIIKVLALVATVAASADAIAAGATISGTIKFEGEAPALKTIDMSQDAICGTNNNNQPVKSQALVLGAGNTLGNVFVYVKSGLAAGKTYTAPTEPVVLDQKGCMYNPHVIGAMVGQPIKILNSDGTMHNVHGLAAVNAEFNEAMPKMKKELTKSFDKEEILFAVKCDVHPWMQAYVGIVSHPFFTVSKEDGKFTISGLDAGTYEIEAIHEKLGKMTASVTVAADGTATNDFTFKKE